MPRRRARAPASWRWGLAAVAAALIVLASSLALWRSRAPEPGSTVERRPANPAVVATPPAPSAPPVAPVPVAPERVASAAPAPRPPGRRRSVPVQATSAVPTTPESSAAGSADRARARRRSTSRRTAWNEALARASAPVSVPLKSSVAPDRRGAARHAADRRCAADTARPRRTLMSVLARPVCPVPRRRCCWPSPRGRAPRRPRSTTPPVTIPTVAGSERRQGRSPSERARRRHGHA